MNPIKTTAKKSASTAAPNAIKNYNEVVAWLDSHWAVGDKLTTVARMHKLDEALGSVAKKVKTILVAGTNGKSLTIHFATQLLQHEGLTVGGYYAPHLVTYNERIALNDTSIANKAFTDLGNTVISMAETLGLEVNSSDVLTMMALLYFHEQKADVALLEVSEGGLYNAVNVCDAKVVTITRATAHDIEMSDADVVELAKEMMGIVKQGTWIVSGDQSKAHLHVMETMTAEQGGQWAMPIRKLAALVYPFEQLHGRCAALAERISQLFINHVLVKESSFGDDSLLAKQKGQRGRPTLEAKRHSELNPKKTIEQFWKECVSTLPGRFQLLNKEKPTLLLDNANNIDAFNNLLLGIRLLHYQRPLKGLVIIVGAAKNTLHNEEFLKAVRYFFKKTAGQLFVCPLEDVLAGNNEEQSWDVNQVTNDVKSMKMKAQGFKSFQEAFDAAKTIVDERQGLVVVTGSQSIINAFWASKGIKKI
jgi:dihydrofolate synthase/folylpolyglutamate synthase